MFKKPSLLKRNRPECAMYLMEIFITSKGEAGRVWQCSNCGHSCEELYGDYEYCPHCAAKVVSDE